MASNRGSAPCADEWALVRGRPTARLATPEGTPVATRPRAAEINWPIASPGAPAAILLTSSDAFCSSERATGVMGRGMVLRVDRRNCAAISFARFCSKHSKVGNCEHSQLPSGDRQGIAESLRRTVSHALRLLIDHTAEFQPGNLTCRRPVTEARSILPFSACREVVYADHGIGNFRNSRTGVGTGTVQGEARHLLASLLTVTQIALA